MTTKFCKVCDSQQPLDNFYIACNATVNRNAVYTTLCKTHSNEKRKVNYLRTPRHKKTGFKKLEENIQQEILTKLLNGIKMTVISTDYNIKYQTLLKWKKSGQLIA